MRQFEIWWANLPAPAGRRPVLLLSRNDAYRYSRVQSSLIGNAGLFGDGGGFNHVVVGQAAAETSASAHDVHGDVGGGNVEDFGDQLATALGSLRGRPEVEFAVVEMRETVFGFHGRVSDEGVNVNGFDGFGGGLESCRGIAIFAKSDGGRLRGEFVGAVEEAFTALLGSGTFVPGDTEFVSRGLGLPPGFGDDGYTRHETENVVGAFDDECVVDAGESFDFVEIDADDSARRGYILRRRPRACRERGNRCCREAFPATIEGACRSSVSACDR